MSIVLLHYADGGLYMCLIHTYVEYLVNWVALFQPIKRLSTVLWLL